MTTKIPTVLRQSAGHSRGVSPAPSLRSLSASRESSVRVSSSSVHCARVSTRASESHGQDDQRITLADGRTMGFSDYGNPDGYPLLYFHGFPSSRLEGSAVDRLARKQNIRFLTLERPGFGISTFQANRRVIDWARDVREFADRLNLSRFAIIGGSGGGPYALACAHELPPSMLSAVGLFASGGPYDKSWEGIPMRSRWGHYTAKYTPWLLSAIGATVVGTGKWAARNGPLAKRFGDFLLDQQEKQIADGSVPRSEAKSTEQLREKAIRVMCEGFAQGPYAFTQEALVLSTHWGFEIENVDFDPVHIWHGTEDVNAPIQWIRNMAKRLPHARLVEFEGHSHYNLVDCLESVLQDLIPESEMNHWRLSTESATD